MSGGKGLHKAALGGCLAAFLWASMSLAQEPQEVVPAPLESQPVPEGRQTTSENGAAGQGQDKEPAPEKLSPSLDKIEAAIRDLITQERAAQGQGPKDEEIRDLEAQEGMALWAKAMFWATIAAVVLTFAGIVLIWRTLHHTRRAANHTEGMLGEAKETTKSARDAVDEAKAATQAARTSAAKAYEISARAVANSEKMGEIQVRAYLIISGVKARWSEKETPTLSITIRNSGQTPAGNVTVKAKCSLSFVLGDKDYFIPNSLKFLEDIGTGNTPEFDFPIDHVIPGDIRKRFKEERSLFKVNIEITYVDVFNKELRGETRLWAMCWEGVDLAIGGQQLSAQPHTWQQHQGQN